MTHDGKVTYLSGGTVYVVALPRGSGSATRLVSSWQLPQLHESENFAGLSRGPNDSVLFHGSWIFRAAETVHMKCEIVQADVRTQSLNTIQANTPHNLTWPVLSPSGTSIAATAIVDGKDVPAILTHLSGEVRTFAYQRNASPHAWVSDTALLLTSLDEHEKWVVVGFDLGNGTYKQLMPGGRPIVARGSGLIASLSSDHESIAVTDASHSVYRTFRGFFKDAIEWIDETKFLYVTGIGYVDSLGIADVAQKTAREYSLPSKGEISGASYTP